MRGRARLVLDTDTFNEIDDQFAVVQALLSKKRLEVAALYAAPFHNNRSSGPADGMRKSYEEILRLLKRLNIPPKGLVFKGSKRWMKDEQSPVDSPAARDLIEKAMAMKGRKPLYVAAVGAPANVASAILMEPEIIKKIVVVWLGGQPPHWNSAREFNLQQNPAASRALLNSGVPLVLFPCAGVTSHLTASVVETEHWLRGKNPIADYLADIFKEYVGGGMGASKVIWDIAAIAYLIDPAWTRGEIVHSPILTEDLTWSRDPTRHFIKIMTWVDRDAIFRDLLEKILRA